MGETLDKEKEETGDKEEGETGDKAEGETDKEETCDKEERGTGDEDVGETGDKEKGKTSDEVKGETGDKKNGQATHKEKGDKGEETRLGQAQVCNLTLPNTNPLTLILSGRSLAKQVFSACRNWHAIYTNIQCTLFYPCSSYSNYSREKGVYILKFYYV